MKVEKEVGKEVRHAWSQEQVGLMEQFFIYLILHVSYELNYLRIH